MTPPTRPPTPTRAVALAAALTLAVSAGAMTDLQRGDPAPRVRAAALDGSRVDTARMKGRILVILFGEAGQDKTHRACVDIAAALESPALSHEPRAWILFLSKGSDPEALPADITASDPRPTVVHDTDRVAFGAYHALVAPTAIVVDGEGRVVHALTGFTHRFGDIVADALLLAAGKLSPQRFEETLHPSTAPTADERRLQADRMVQFARHLARRGEDEMAEAKYRECLEFMPDSIPARLGLGDLLLSGSRFGEAEQRFREVLAAEPGSTDGALGLGFVLALRPDADLERAGSLAAAVLESDARRPRAHYLLGIIHEKRGESGRAAAAFKRAADLLLAKLGQTRFVVDPDDGP